MAKTRCEVWAEWNIIANTMNLEIKKRWGATIGQAFIERLANVGRSGNGLEISESPFGVMKETGQLDLRGLILPARTELRRINFKSADFTQATLKQLWFESCFFDAVTFDSASLNGLSDINNTFTQCSFHGTNFRKAKIGYRGSRYRQCRFVQSDFLQAGFVRPEFDDCFFENCAFSGTDFRAASFQNCQFLGDVRGVWFRGKYQLSSSIEQFPTSRENTMQRVSFKKARLMDVTFSDCCDLSTVLLPEDGKYAVFDNWSQSIERVYTQSGSWMDPIRIEAQNFYKSYRSHAQTQKWYILGEDDLINRHGRAAGKRIWEVLLAKTE